MFYVSLVIDTYPCYYYIYNSYTSCYNISIIKISIMICLVPIPLF